MNLSVVIPAYNEEKRIGNTLTKLVLFLENNSDIENHEIIIVDDGSKDGTISQIPQNEKIVILKNEANFGKGYSVKKGVLKARHDLILFMDSDLATPLRELAPLSQFILQGDYDISIASRNIDPSRSIVKQPKYRQWAGSFFPKLVILISGLKFKDTQCGFKLMRKEPAKKIFSQLTINRFAFDVEMLYLAKKYGYKVAEVPATWIDQKGTTVHFFRDSWRMFRDLWKIRLNDLSGKYK